MSNKSDLAKQKALKASSDTLNAEGAGDRSAARTPGVVESAQTHEVTHWFDFLKDPNRDFSKAPMPFTGMAEDGAAGAEEERTALGAMKFGTVGADPNLQALLKANISERRAQRRGQALESAVGRYDAGDRWRLGEHGFIAPHGTGGHDDERGLGGVEFMGAVQAARPLGLGSRAVFRLRRRAGRDDGSVESRKRRAFGWRVRRR